MNRRARVNATAARPAFPKTRLHAVRQRHAVALILCALLTCTTSAAAQPSFSSSSPANGTHATTLSSNISATFSQAIAAGTVSSSNFVVHGGFVGHHSTGGTASTHKDGTYTGQGTTTLTFNPGLNFKPGEKLSVTLTTALQNSGAQALTSARVYEFRAAAGAGPAIFSHSTHDVDTPTNWTNAMSLGDLDADGDLDLVAGNLSGSQVNRIYLGSGSGTFASGSDLDATTKSTQHTALGDLDADGDLDLVTGNQGQTNQVYLSNGNGTFAAASDVDTPTNTTREVALGDLDGDGDLDLVSANQNQVNRVYLSNGNGTFASGNNVDTPTNTTTSAELGDLDLDGDLDLIVGNENQVNRFYLNNGNGTFASGSDVDTPTNATRDIALGDLDADGDLDLITGNYNQVNRRYLNNGNGTFASGSDIDTPTNATKDIALGDLDGDGDLDLITGNNNQTDKLYLSNGDGTFSTGSDVAATTHSTASTALGDLDADGDLDFVAGNFAQVNRVYLNSGNKDGTLTASATVDESSAIALPSTATTSSAAVDLFDFTLTDGGGGDALALSASQVVVHTSGTGPFSQLTWLLNGPDASNVSGTYSSSANTITFAGLSISIADGANETYTLRGYYSSNTGLTDGTTFSFSIDGDTDLTVGATGSSISGSNASISNATAALVGVTATQLAFATQPAPLSLVSGTALDFSTDPVVAARDAAGNTDTDFSSVVTLAENGAGSSTFSNSAITPTSGTATFSGLTLTYNATSSASIALTASASGVSSATSSSIAVIAAPQLAHNTGAQAGEGGSVVLSSGALQFTAASSTTAQVVYTLVAAPTVGQLKKSGTVLAASDTFSQEDIDNGRMSYVHSGDEVFSDGFSFTVKGSVGIATSTAHFDLAIAPADDAPTLDVQQTLLLNEGEEISITNGSLRALDAEALPQHIAYTVLQAPAHGHLNLSSFTQDDIDSGRLSYRHDGSETTQDAFSFVVEDGAGNQLTPQTLTLRISPVNEAPVIPRFDPPAIDEGQELVLQLAATDPEGDSITLSTSDLPPGATLSGTMLTWRPTYEQAGRYPLVVVYDDGRGGQSRLRTDIEVRNELVPSFLSESAQLDFGDIPAGTAVEKTFALTNPTAFPLRIEKFIGDAAFSVVTPVLPIELAAGTSIALKARFTARSTTAEMQRAVLSAQSNMGAIQLSLSGRSLWNDLVTATDSIDFGTRIVGAAPFRDLALNNPGNLPLDLNATALDNGLFRIEPSSFSLAGGETRSVRIHYAPKAALSYEQVLVLTEQTSDEQRATIALSGRGTMPQEGPVSIDFNLAPGNQHQRQLGNAQPTQRIDVQLHVRNAKEITGWSARIDYDPQALSYIAASFAPGDMLSNSTRLEENGAGYVEVGGSVLGGAQSTTSSGLLGTLSFQVGQGFTGASELAVTRLTWHRTNGGSARDIVYAPAAIRSAAVVQIEPGDFDANGRLDLDDFHLLKKQFERQVPPAPSHFDLDKDGRIYFGDLFLFSDRYRATGAKAGKLLALTSELLGLPPQSTLQANYPNPFNAATTLPYIVAQKGPVQLAIYDAVGQQVRLLVDQFQEAGRYQLTWDGTDQRGRAVASGLYLARLSVGEQMIQHKLLLVR